MINENVKVLKDDDAMADFAVSRFMDFYNEAINARGRFVIALSGGNTPRKFYLALAASRNELDWSLIDVFLVDERFVPTNDADSNYRLLQDTLLNPVGIPSENCHLVPIMDSVKESASAYETILVSFFKNELPVFDLVMLGIGSDGHTASIFPGSVALEENERWVMPVEEPDVSYSRITLTLPVINHARHVIVYISGQEKSKTVERVIEQKDMSLPASHVMPTSRNLQFILDEPASECLER